MKSLRACFPCLVRLSRTDLHACDGDALVISASSAAETHLPKADLFTLKLVLNDAHDCAARLLEHERFHSALLTVRPAP